MLAAHLQILPREQQVGYLLALLFLQVGDAGAELVGRHAGQGIPIAGQVVR